MGGLQIDGGFSEICLPGIGYRSHLHLMPRASILDPNKSYTFRNYFEMSYEPDDILAEFDYSLTRSSLNLPS